MHESLDRTFLGDRILAVDFVDRTEQRTERERHHQRDVGQCNVAYQCCKGLVETRQKRHAKIKNETGNGLDGPSEHIELEQYVVPVDAGALCGFHDRFDEISFGDEVRNQADDEQGEQLGRHADECWQLGHPAGEIFDQVAQDFVPTQACGLRMQAPV